MSTDTRTVADLADDLAPATVDKVRHLMWPRMWPFAYCGEVCLSPKYGPHHEWTCKACYDAWQRECRS